MRPASAVRAAALAAWLLPGLGSAAVLHDEALPLQGDLAGSPAAATLLLPQPGANDLLGTTGAGAGGVDIDLALVRVQGGQRLGALRVLSGTLPAGGVSFVALVRADQAGFDPLRPNPGALLGWAHFDETEVGLDLLPRMGQAVSAQGFAGPLGAGDYLLWVQDTNFGTARYALRLEVSAVPEPGTLAMLWLGLAALGAKRARRG